MRAKLEEKRMLVPPTNTETVLMAELDAILFKIMCEERTFRLSEKVVLECEVSILSFENELVTASNREKELEHKVSSLEGLLVSINEQLKKMGDGGGCALFPRPISQSPELPVAVTHTLNA